LVHGLGYSPDHRTLAVVSIGSNSVTLIDTTTNKIKGTVYVGRSPHEAFFTPDGKELWVAVRGEDYIAVLNPVALKEVRRIQTANGPGMVLFRPDGRYAFVPSSFTPELVVIDTAGYKVVARIKQASPFSPNLAVSPDGKEVWFTLKDTGKTQVMSADPPFKIMATLDTGPVTNHVALVDNAKGSFAYVTVGGLNEVKVFRRNGADPKLLTTIPVGQMPHGIWPSGDGSRVYIGLENGDQVQAIDTETNKVIATILVGQAPQALVYVPNAMPMGSGKEGLKPLQEVTSPLVISLEPVDKVKSSAKGTVVIRTIGLIDHLQLTLTGLKPDQEYDLILAKRAAPPYGSTQPLTTVKTDNEGKATGQALGPIRKVVANPADAPKEDAGRRGTLILVQNGDTMAPPVLTEKRP
jgi:YVTN family beta-propeller protein